LYRLGRRSEHPKIEYLNRDNAKAGSKVGPYKLVGKLGSGGMGEVGREHPRVLEDIEAAPWIFAAYGSEQHCEDESVTNSLFRNMAAGL